MMRNRTNRGMPSGVLHPFANSCIKNLLQRLFINLKCVAGNVFLARSSVAQRGERKEAKNLFAVLHHTRQQHGQSKLLFAARCCIYRSKIGPAHFSPFRCTRPSNSSSLSLSQLRNSTARSRVNIRSTSSSLTNPALPSIVWEGPREESLTSCSVTCGIAGRSL